MFKTLLAVIAIFSQISFADDATYLECNSTNFRQNGGWEIQESDNAFLMLKLEQGAIQPVLTVKTAYVNFGGYIGVISDLQLVEKPYERTPSAYKNHHRWEMDAEETYGHEDGMWGYLVVNQEALGLNKYGVTDAHFYLQSGDHHGGTVDFTCESVYHW
ncbi:MAG: hypothetical protein HRT45_15845 [Bdellovibrionales bacterium]|nr:hypothetical protein [Bdellovibrionales bacterium]